MLRKHVTRYSKQVTQVRYSLPFRKSNEYGTPLPKTPFHVTRYTNTVLHSASTILFAALSMLA